MTTSLPLESPERQPRAGRPRWLDVLGVVLLSAGSLLLPLVGWIAGVVVVLSSSRFRRSDRILALLAPPLGLLLPMLLALAGAGARSCFEDSKSLPDGTQQVLTSGCDPLTTSDLVLIVLLGLSLALAMITTVRLTTQLRRGM